ncbi:MAG: hypothetical protein K1X72_11560 [Pyrinomonadaceae bacterium]|nr:hypothetical protein [Pyrinomonadaceae bacterium]
MEKVTKNSLFLELAQPDENGVSRWVSVTEFVERYASLKFGNGADWARSDGSLAKKYHLERDSSQTVGNSVDRIRLNGFRNDDSSNQVRADLKREIKKRRCVILGTSNPEADHKDGRKDNSRVMNLKTQVLDDFQPLSKAANDAKRQICKECKATDIRFDAKRLGYPISVTKGSLNYEESVGCDGCFWYDPLDFRKNLKEIDSEQIHKIIEDCS